MLFREFTSNPTEFRYSVNDKWLIRQIIEHVKSFNGKRSHFRFSLFESELKTPVESFPFFGTTKIETKVNCEPDLKKTVKKTFENPILLNRMVAEAEKNCSKSKHGFRYDENIKEVASYIRMLSGKLAYETLQNLCQLYLQ